MQIMKDEKTLLNVYNRNRSIHYHTTMANTVADECFVVFIL